MNFLDRALWRLFERRFHVSQQPADWFMRMVGGKTSSGVDVTTEGSLSYSAVFACVRVLSETVASLPLLLYRRLERGKERATDHSLYDLLHDAPNPEMTAFEFRETLMIHLGLWGNAFAEIEYNNAGRVRGLWPLRPDRMRVMRSDGRLRYIYRLSEAKEVELPFERVMHIRGLSSDGVIGYSPIDLAREAIALGLATEEFGSRFFSNGTQVGMIYEHPGKLSKEAYERLQDSLEKRHQGLTNAHRIMILEEGLKANQVGVNPDNAQFLETRKFQLRDIERWYRMPPHKIADLEQATFSNIEHQAIEFVTDTVRPWLVRWEQAIKRDLLSPAERQTLFAEHLVDALLRGDIASRYAAYAQGRQNGWLSADDIRELENMNPLPNGEGAIYLVPLNMVPANQVSGDQSTDSQDSLRSQRSLELRSLNADAERRARVQNLAKARQRLAKSYRRMVADAVGRVMRREIADVRRAVTKHLGQRDAFALATWLKQFYEEHREFWTRQILPVLMSYADQVGASVADELGGDARDSSDIRQFIEDYAAALAKREVGSSINQLQDLLDRALQDGEDPGEALNARLDEWEEKRVNKITRREVTGILGACTLAYYVLVGVTRKRWVNTGSENCPYCQALDGSVAEIEKFFLQKDTDFAPEGSERPLNVRYDVGHAPAHDGCDCIIVAD